MQYIINQKIQSCKDCGHYPNCPEWDDESVCNDFYYDNESEEELIIK